MELSTAGSEAVVTADLISASYRSDSFPHDWTAEERARSFDRYCRWLRLKQQHPTARMAPTRDIDLFWHLHMLSPVAYHRDCERLFGRLLDHDGGFGKGEGELQVLQEVFLETARLWEDTYDEAYREDGQFVRDGQLTNCWHNCQSRCWHACSSK
jgi:hypothetical protein